MYNFGITIWIISFNICMTLPTSLVRSNWILMNGEKSWFRECDWWMFTEIKVLSSYNTIIRYKNIRHIEYRLSIMPHKYLCYKHRITKPRSYTTHIGIAYLCEWLFVQKLRLFCSDYVNIRSDSIVKDVRIWSIDWH